MSPVGPGDSGKTRLIFAMLASPTTFISSCKKTYYFNKEYQPLLKEMAEKLNIEFVPCLDFEMIEKLENCLLVFEDSCEEIYPEKEFMIVVAGRQRRFIAFSSNIIFIRASGRVLLTSIQHTSYLSLHVMFSKLITLVDN